MAALCAIVCCNLAVVDGSHAAVRCVLRTLTIGRRAISFGSVEIAGSIVTRFGLLVSQPGRDVTIACRQPGFPTAHRRQLVGTGILAVLRGLRAIFGCNSAVVDGSYPTIRGTSAPRVGPGAFGCSTPAIARRAISCGSVELTGRVVTRFGLTITLLGGEVTRPRRQPQSFALLCGLCAIFSCESAVVDCLGAVIRSLSATRGGLGTFVRRMLPVRRRSIPCGSVKIARRVIPRFGLSVTQPGRGVTVLRGQAGLPTAHSG